MSGPAQTGTEAIVAVATGAASVSNVVEDCLDKVCELDASVGAFRLIDKEWARYQAKHERGDRCSASEYLSALEGRKEALRTLAPLAAAADLVLTPGAVGVAPEGFAFTGDPVMCRPWTLLGLPAANVPAYRRPDGLPVGVHFVGLGRDDLSCPTSVALVEAALNDKED